MDVLDQLTQTIKARRLDTAERSYTRQLLDGGPPKCAKKLGEEAVETVIAGVSQDDAALKAEAADLLFHLMVLLEARGLTMRDVLDVLAQRSGVSGHTEKAGRAAK